MTSLEIPAFPTETAEAEWWDSNQDWIVQQFERADADGRLGHGRALAQVRAVQTDCPQAALTIQPYKQLLEKLIHDGLEREEQAA
jgi:hypothetical protein